MSNMMDSPQHRKRKRRRADKPPISAHLVLNEALGGDIGILSDDLRSELFPGTKFFRASDDAITDTDIDYVAIAPWGPVTSHIIEDGPWTILPVKTSLVKDSSLQRPAHSTLEFSGASLALQTFAQNLRSFSLDKASNYKKASIRIRLLEVVPLKLNTVYVRVDSEFAKKLENGTYPLAGFDSLAINGFAGKGKGKGKGKSLSSTRLHELDRAKSPAQVKEMLRKAVREVLQASLVTHTGDFMPLPFPSHPITHVPPPPAKIIHAEPVSQGVISSRTKVVLIRTDREYKVRPAPKLPIHKSVNGPVEDDEDTSDDRFYSAAEDRSGVLTPSPEKGDDEGGLRISELSESEASGATSDGESDDSIGNIDALNTLKLSSQTQSVLSAFESGTPAGGRRTNGISTPGSMVSAFTSTTAQAGGTKGRLFKAQGLLQRISDDLLHPKPISDDDEEARLFVDVAALAKIGCFSGDWVRVEASAEPRSELGSWGLAFQSVENGIGEWRAAKIYGLPDMYSRSLRQSQALRSSQQLRHTSIRISSPGTLVYLSPLLLANLKQPTHLCLSPLAPAKEADVPMSPNMFKKKQAKVPSSSHPPVAREVSFLKIMTPASTERAMQAAFLAGLRDHFEQKLRIVKSGDLIAIVVDESLGKVLQVGNVPAEDPNSDESLLAASSAELHNRHESNSNTMIAWLRVGKILPAISENTPDSDQAEVWGGLATVDSMTTRMAQTDSERSRLPSTRDSHWDYYLGVRASPRMGLQRQLPLAPAPAPYVSPLRRRLRELISAATTPRAIHLGLKPVVILLVSNQRNIGKATTAEQACGDLGMHTYKIDAYDVLAEGGASGGDVKTEGIFKARCERALSWCSPEACALLIRHVEALSADRMITALKEVFTQSRVVIATTTEVDKVPDDVRSLFTHELEMFAPDEGERTGLLKAIVENRGVLIAPNVELSAVALKTAALVAGDLVDIIDRAILAQKKRLEQLVKVAQAGSDYSAQVNIRDIQISGGNEGRCLTSVDFEGAVDAARKNFSDAIGAPKIPSVSWEDVGGLTEVKEAVMETIQLPLERPELFATGMKKRSGILFYGPPGTGKTLLAKAIATEFSLNFFSVKGPELLNMYIGESEANVRRVFQRARDARPCVVFFDELDSVAPKRGNQGDSGGVMDRIVSQLLAELDGMSDGKDGAGGVFVIGATNRPDLLDTALLRPGRFDKMLYLGVSDTHEKQLKILEALTRKFHLHPSLLLRRVAESLPFTYTGADLYALCSDAMLKAVTRQVSAVHQKIENLPGGPVSTAYFFDHFATEEDIAVMVTEDDFVLAQRELIGSISARELDHYRRVRETFQG